MRADELEHTYCEKLVITNSLAYKCVLFTNFCSSFMVWYYLHLWNARQGFRCMLFVINGLLFSFVVKINANILFERCCTANRRKECITCIHIWWIHPSGLVLYEYFAFSLCWCCVKKNAVSNATAWFDETNFQSWSQIPQSNWQFVGNFSTVHNEMSLQKLQLII